MVQDNYETILSNVQRVLTRWTALPASLWSRIAVVKMNIVPHVNFFKFNDPLTPTNELLEET